jgi:transmembrane sensor
MTLAADIEAQAAAWLMKRDAVGEDAETADFTAWLAADPRHRAAYLRLAAAWARTAKLNRMRPDGGVVDPDLLTPAKSRSRWAGWRMPLALAAGLVAVAAIAAAWWISLPEFETYRTDVGGLSRVILKDGSAVTLNTDTELRVRFSAARREVELLRGEAQFSVVHDTTRPFEVLAGGRLVRAVGTAFDVRLDHGESMEVMVTEGRVAFLDAPSGSTAQTVPTSATISAGEAAVATREKVTIRRVSVTEASRQLAWQIGELSFQGETLSEAVAEFNRYNRKKLRVEDPSIGSLQIGGNFQALDVDSFVAALSRSFRITATSAGDGTVILEGPRTATPD